MFDLKIVGGLVVDGTGRPARGADVSIGATGCSAFLTLRTKRRHAAMNAAF